LQHIKCWPEYRWQAFYPGKKVNICPHSRQRHQSASFVCNGENFVFEIKLPFQMWCKMIPFTSRDQIWCQEYFQRSLFLRITTLFTWLKSTLLLKIKCFDTAIYMKTQCLQTNEIQHYSWKERCLRSGVGERKGSIN